MLVRGFRAGLNQPRRKPAGYAADRNRCTLQTLHNTLSRGCPLVETPEGGVPEHGRLPRPRVRYIPASARFLVARAEGGRR
jgi:hypothetical protein